MNNTGTVTPPSPPPWGPAVIGISLLFLLAGVLLGTAAQYSQLAPMAPMLPQILLWVAMAGAIALAVWMFGSKHLVADLQLRFRAVDLVIGLICGLGLRALALVGEGVSSGWNDFRLPSVALFNEQLPPSFWLSIVIVPVFIAPFIEECFFRGLLQRSIGLTLVNTPGSTSTVPSAIAIAASAVTFSLVHVIASPTITTAVVTLTVGLTCATLFAVTGRLGPAIVTHLAFNAGAVVLLLIGTFG